jgi:hypothetical protein
MIKMALSIDLYSKIISNGPIRVIQDDKLTINGGDLGWAEHVCTVDASYFFEKKTPIGWYNSVRELKSFIFASYATYIPYGNLGYQKAKEILKEQNISLSLEEFRFEKFKKIMDYNLDDLSVEEMEYIKSFFTEFEKEIIDVKSPKDVAIMWSRIHNEIESNFVMIGGYDIKVAKQEMLTIIMDDSITTAANINSYLSRIKKVESLSAEQVEFIKSYLTL